jgi:hypothetical protein
MANTTGKKFGGREKGTPNKTTEEIRERFQLLISDNLEKLQEDLEALDPDKRLKYIIELSKFVIPTLKATDITATGELPQFIINLGGGVNPEEDEKDAI